MRWLALCLAIGLAGGCSKAPGKTYPIDPQTVAARVKATQVPMLLFTEVEPLIAVTRQQDQAGHRFEWSIKGKGTELFRYVAIVTPLQSDKTQVVVTMEPGSGERSAAIFQKLQAEPDIAKTYQVSMVEAVDASIEQRKFEPNPLYTQMMVALFRNKEKMFEGLREQTAAADQRRLSNIERAYAAQGKKY